MEVRSKGRILTEEEALDIAHYKRQDIVVWDEDVVVAVYTKDGRLVVVRKGVPDEARIR